MARMLNLKVPFEVSSNQAFYYLLMMENKRRISIKSLVTYRDSLFAKLIDCKNKNIDPLFENMNIVYTQINGKREANRLVEMYPNIYYLDGEDVVLKDEVTNTDLNKLKHGEEQRILGLRKGHCFFYTEELNDYQRNLLGISKIIKELRLRNGFEEQIERLYLLHELKQDDDKLEIRDKIMKLLEERSEFYYSSILLNGLYASETYYQEARTLGDYYKIDYPVDFDHWQRTDLYNPNWRIFGEDDSGDLEEAMADAYQWAVFCNFPLASYKIANDTQVIRIENIFDYEGKKIKDIEEVRSKSLFNIPERELLFWLLYIKKIDEIIEKYGSNQELLIAKARLLYVLDSAGYNLLDKKKFDSKLESLYSLVDYEEYEDESDEELEAKLELLNSSIDNNSIDNRNGSNNDQEYVSLHPVNSSIIFAKEDYMFWRKEALYFLIDAFECQNNESILLKKLMFTSVYYSLTSDERVVEILNRYVDNPNYVQYARIILGNKFIMKLRLVN